MADTMTSEQRSRCMSHIKGRDTKPELLVRRYLFAKGLRFRVNVTKLPGKPDIVLPKYCTAVFINGCFWHGHDNCKYYRLPKSNVEFWQSKIERNRKRDAEVDAALQAQGWRVLRVWECKLRSKATLEDNLEAIYRSIVGSQDYDLDEAANIAAEPRSYYH